MESAQLYLPIAEIEKELNLNCLHIDLCNYSDEFLLDNLKHLLSDYQYSCYNVVKHKTTEINGDGLPVFLGAFIVGTDFEITKTLAFQIFQKYYTAKPHILNVPEKYLLSREEYLALSNNYPLTQRPELNANSYLDIANDNLNNDTADTSSNSLEEDLNKAAREMAKGNYFYGIIVDDSHTEKVASIPGVVILGKNDLSHFTHFKAPKEAKNKVLGQMVKITDSIKDDEFLEFYKM